MENLEMELRLEINNEYKRLLKLASKIGDLEIGGLKRTDFQQRMSSLSKELYTRMKECVDEYETFKIEESV